MSSARPAARSIVSWRLASASVAPPSSSRLAASAPSTCHHFHSSTQLAVRRRPRFRNIPAEEMGLVTNQKIDKWAAKKFPKYTPEEMEELSKNYSPEQIAALEAGEASIDPRDLTIQGRLRTDSYRMPYIDDFADIQPIIDKRPRRQPPPDPMARFMNLDEFTEDLVAWSQSLCKGEKTGKLKRLEAFVPQEFKKVPEGEWPAGVRADAVSKYTTYIEDEAFKAKLSTQDGSNDGPSDADVLEYILERSSMTDNNLKSNSSMAPALPNKVPGVAGLYKNAVDPEDRGNDEEGIYQDLKKRTGMTLDQILKITVKTVVTRYVTNQTRLGKIQTCNIIALAGNRDGWLGIGVASSVEFQIAKRKAELLAIQNMQPIRRYEDRTIYGNVEAKISGTVVRLNARPPGFGLRVSHRIFEMCRAAGIKDLAATIPRSRNPMNTVKAVFEALRNQPDPEEIAIGRGKKLVDVRKVYYGGQVY
ncbi:ribosomal protein S5, C-terminal domain-containing protein [Lasiosphaeris hirsuta]|uniref:Ribosomal protein S5, C-terminal domain-containing protein n=1 Tax=Lasiosphaeris hirsuta TaxID=260670 RepID=A0AA40DIX9_9PEZI|nr:ribosomal protein S5, C-terminal domain-containing protein [Lasiosphaeris hirsuta]